MKYIVTILTFLLVVSGLVAKYSIDQVESLRVEVLQAQGAVAAYKTAIATQQEFFSQREELALKRESETREEAIKSKAQYENLLKGLASNSDWSDSAIPECLQQHFNTLP